MAAVMARSVPCLTITLGSVPAASHKHCLAVVLHDPTTDPSQMAPHLILLLMLMESLSTWMTLVQCCLALGAMNEHWPVLFIPTYVETDLLYAYLITTGKSLQVGVTAPSE